MTRKISEPKFNVSKLRISEYTGDGTHSLHSKNFGVVELMILESIRKCIDVKVKWVMALELAHVSYKMRRNSVSAQSPKDTIQVVTEIPLDGPESNVLVVPISIQDDSAASGMEGNLSYCTSVLSRLLARYGLLEQIAFTQEHITDENIPWRNISFTQLRSDLIELFKKRNERIGLTDTVKLSNGHSMATFVGDLVRTQSKGVRKYSASASNFQTPMPTPPRMQSPVSSRKTVQFERTVSSSSNSSVRAKKVWSSGAAQGSRGNTSPITPLTHDSFKFF